MKPRPRASWNRAAYDNYEASYQLTDFTDVPVDPTGQIVLLNYEEYAQRRGGPEVATLAAATQIVSTAGLERASLSASWTPQNALLHDRPLSLDPTLLST